MIKYLKLRVHAPFVYFADNDRPQFSTTAEYYTNKIPTKGVVSGMLGSALGYKRDSKEMNELRKKLTDIKCEIINPGIEIEDYQTVHFMPGYKAVRLKDSYDKKFNINDMKIPSSDEVKTGPIKNVHYLNDFDCYLYIGGTEEDLKKYHEALLNPVWPVYFGKKCCLPTAPIVKKIIEIVEKEELKDEVISI